jgi:hypothetical protein
VGRSSEVDLSLPQVVWLAPVTAGPCLNWNGRMTTTTARSAGPILSRPQRNWLTSLHVAAGGAWLGAALCMLIISWTNQDPGRHHPVDLVLEDLDLLAMIPAPLLASASGLLLCWGTTWGFFRWRWVVAKQAVTYSMMVAAPFTLHEWIARMAALSGSGLAGPPYAEVQRLHVLGSVAMVLGIAGVVVLSVLKPWGRRRVDH